jgi:UDP-N-acetylglucosamine--N-acetylmuramyl-(pentapeptide) pyrophosphoryl-undecaprenol N-acetylglucosamine transferase
VRVVISAGGTGGHIYPALAIINKIKELEPNSEFLYIGTHNRMEKDIVPKHNIPFKELEVYGFNRNDVMKNFKTLKKLIKAYQNSKKIIKNFNPDIVVGVGGYVTVPVVLASFRLKYKTFIHEQNSVPGLSNKILSYFATKIGVSFISSINYFPKHKAVFTGNPCSEDAINKPIMDKSEIGLSSNKKLVYIVMGSLGASRVSDILMNTLPMFNGKNYEVLFVTGKDLYEKVMSKQYPSNVFVVPYIDNQTRMMKNADVIITRCGATTLSEIIALEKPSILIPSPYVPNNHQYKNAMDLIKEDAAIMIEEVDLNGSLLVDAIDNLIFNEERIIEMKAGLYKMHIDHSATKIYNLLKEMSK